MWLDSLTNCLADLEKFLEPLHCAEFQPNKSQYLDNSHDIDLILVCAADNPETCSLSLCSGLI